MKNLIFLFTLSLFFVGIAWADTYSENFDFNDYWYSEDMGNNNAKTYISPASPANDAFSSDSALRETYYARSKGFAWKLQSGSHYFRYECSETVSGFSVYLARWDNSPRPSFTIRYSTDSGSTYTNIEALNGDWFLDDKSYMQYNYTFLFPISPSSGNKIYLEINKTAGQEIFVDDFILRYVPPAAAAATTAIAATAIHNAGFTANWNTVARATGYCLDVYTLGAAATTNLIISEYIEGLSNKKAIEIFNGTGVAVDLSNYSLMKQADGAGEFCDELTLGGTLAHNSVYVIAYYPSQGSYITGNMVNLRTKSNVMNFNGNDVLALYHNGIQIDLVGVVNQIANWGADMTLVRKAAAISPTTAYSINDWDQYPVDTLDYLGFHTMISRIFVSGYENYDAGNTTQKVVTGLSPNTTYKYVVRAYNAYGTSIDSNEISVTTGTAQVVVVNDDGTATGASITHGGTIPESLLGTDSGIPAVIYTINTSGTKNVIVHRPSWFGNIDWYCWLVTLGGQILEGSSIDPFNSSYSFENVNFDAKGDVVVVLNDNPTLPLELSSFTVSLSGYNDTVLTWVTQTETGVSGFYIYRNTEYDLGTAELISNLIPATNTSQQKVYVYTDKNLSSPGTYYYWLENVDYNGASDFHGPIHINVISH